MTKILSSLDSKSSKIATKILEDGGVIVFPTDTIYGLACDASNDKALQKLFKVKKRSKNKAISLFVKNLIDAKNLMVFSDIAIKIANKFMPRGLTLVLPKKHDLEIDKQYQISKIINNNNEEYLGFRIPYHDFSIKLLNDFNKTLAVTSVNISGFEAKTNFDEIYKLFYNKVDLIIDGDKLGNIPSSVIRITNDNKIEFLREGLICKKEFLEFLDEIDK